ncbi:unnamed protein product [Vicia faba]|uniref:Uncharacterized protein n=1 Tax=Vicia faba TaxID=3906 RepID=A0AAV1AWJ1_VICFA|nr:unnamed protein product [Vicia faba]CAI8613548.1 unnamed protein product [Vicia faba]
MILVDSKTTKVKDTGSAVKNVLSVIESLKKQVAMKHIVSLKYIFGIHGEIKEVIRTYALNKTWWISFLMDIIRDIVDVKGNISAYTINRENLNNRQKLGCEKGTGIDRARMNMTKLRNSGIS